MLVDDENARDDCLQFLVLLRALSVYGLVLVVSDIVIVSHAIVFKLVVVEGDVFESDECLQVRA